LTKLENIR